MNDAHPIPQDVTGFQFKLIGNMTLKQFLFLGSGCIISWICYSLPFPFLAKVPLVILPGGFGFFFAFVPIEGRSMDTMLSYFIKALFAPDQYLYVKIGKPIDIPLSLPKKKQAVSDDITKINQEHITALLQSMIQKSTKPTNVLDQKEDLFLKNIFSQTPSSLSASIQQPPQIISMNVVSQPISPVSPVMDEKEPLPPKKIEFNHENPEELEKELDIEAKELQQELNATAPLSAEKTHDLQKQLEEILAEKKLLEEELFVLKTKLETKSPPKQPVKQFASPVPSFAPEAPNLITGIVKDPKGNVLPNILVDIQDPDGNPVRAFKTNVLGQFASATSLPNGAYKITFEDASERHTFTPVQLTTQGKPIPPLDVIAIDQRDELRKELFGK